jgi:hypothetical protein
MSGYTLKAGLGPGQQIAQPAKRPTRPLPTRLTEAITKARSVLAEANKLDADLGDDGAFDGWLMPAVADLLVEASTFSQQRMANAERREQQMNDEAGT